MLILSAFTFSQYITSYVWLHGEVVPLLTYLVSLTSLTSLTDCRTDLVIQS